jgi:hypothetical protein
MKRYLVGLPWRQVFASRLAVLVHAHIHFPFVRISHGRKARVYLDANGEHFRYDNHRRRLAEHDSDEEQDPRLRDSLAAI